MSCDLCSPPREGGGGNGAIGRSSLAVVEAGCRRRPVARRGGHSVSGLSIASAVRWLQRFCASGEIWPAPTGGIAGPAASRRIAVTSRSHSPPAGPYAVGNPGASDRQLRRRSSSSVIGGSSIATRSLLKKDRARRGAAAPGRLEAAPELFGRNSTSIRENSFSSMKRGASTNLARKGGRCRRGRRLRVGIPHGHYKTVTLVAGLRLSGLVAQKAFDKPMNGATFEEWVEKCLVDTLERRHRRHGQSVEPQGPRVEQLIEAAGAELRYLPPYSPDMNPIEKAYSKLKSFLRKISERTVAGLMQGARSLRRRLQICRMHKLLRRLRL